jgi:hypothetical protein
VAADLSKLFIAFALGAMALTGISFFMAGLGAEYGFDDNSSTFQTISENFNVEFNQTISEASNSTAQGGIDPLSGLLNPFTKAWNSILGFFNSPKTMISMVNELAAEAGIGGISWFWVGITLVISTIVVLSLIAVLTGRKP